MLKWTASAQKLNVLQTPTPMPMPMQMPTPTSKFAIATDAAAMRTPQQRRQRRRATIAHNGCDKENMLPVTSTPIVPAAVAALRVRNSPLVLAPLADILNVTPEQSPQTQTPHSHRARRSVAAVASTPLLTPTQTPIVARRHARPPNRRHSTVGFTLPMQQSEPARRPPQHEYAPTLPCYAEEDYSPGARALPSGQELALRGLMPVPFLTTMRYFQTPDALISKRNKPHEQQQQQQHEQQQRRKEQEHDQPKEGRRRCAGAAVRPQKRKLEEEFECAHIAVECEATAQQRDANNVTSTTSSAKMGDQTLDQLIDAILDSARKEEKHKKPRKSFNLRRRTLLKNQTEQAQQQQPTLLSPSYAAGDDPASDLSFLLCETALHMPQPAKATTTAQLRRSLTTLLSTPAPATPPPGTPIPLAVLQRMRTPAAAPPPQPPSSLAAVVTKPALKMFAGSHQQHSNDSFNLATPVRALTKRRRQQQQQQQQQHRLPNEVEDDAAGSALKKFKGDAHAHNYFEVGLALPSIYV